MVVVVVFVRFFSLLVKYLINRYTVESKSLRCKNLNEYETIRVVVVVATHIHVIENRHGTIVVKLKN